MVDKVNDELIMFCNECDWKENTTGLKYEFCPKCGHVNIGFSKNINNEEDKMPIWMLRDHTEKELKDLYEALPFVRNEMTFNEYKEEWKRQRELYKINL